MKQTRATIRYAKALLDFSIKENSLEEVYKDMILVSRVCAENKDFRLLLKSPIIKTDKKIKAFEQIFKEKITKISIKFIKIITNKKRESLLENIASSFILKYKEHKNIMEATVTTASPLSEDLKQEIIKYIKQKVSVDVDLKHVIDQNIIGGTIIQIGDKQLDISVSSEILKLKKEFNKNLSIKDS